MRKSLKKPFAVLSAAAIAATMITVPTIAGAAGIEADYDNGKLVITTDAAFPNAKVMVAKYGSDNALEKVSITDAALSVGENKIDVTANPGEKIYVWDNMTPLIAPAILVEDVSDTEAPTADTTTAPATEQPTADATAAPPSEQPTEDAEIVQTWKFDFGSADDVAEGYTAVPADLKYSNETGYGFIGLENGYAEDARTDGWTMTQGYDIELANGADENIAAAEDDYVATTVRDDINMVSPIRFAMKSEPNTYYKVKINLRRADASKDAEVSLFTEKRHQHLLNEPIPADGLTYETAVYVHNNWSKKTYEYTDKMLNISAIGENVAISSIEVAQLKTPGKTLFIVGDSTVCEQTAAIPYFPLDHCQGVGSGMTKYLGTDWAIVNEAESGLSASASTNHFANMINDVKPGDVVWFEFGHNDDKITNDPATNGYLNTLESFYNQVTEKGASFVAVAPIDRDQKSQYNETDGTFSSTLSHYSAAASNFVETKIAAGATNIAYIDLNAPCIKFLDEIASEINPTYDYGFEATRFYYYVSKKAGYQQDYTHPNDFGADNFAKMFVDGANALITAAAAEEASDSVKTQAAVLAPLMAGQRNVTAVRVPESIYSLGKPANSAYPSDLTEVVYYDFPWLISNAAFDEEGYPVSLNGKSVPCKDISSVYGRGVVEIYNADGSLKGKTISSGDVAFFDSSIEGDQTLTFADKTVAYDSSAGETYKVYVTDIDQMGQDSDTIVSNTLTEKDNVDVKEYLLQGKTGRENKEDFSTYGLTEGDSIIGQGGWSNPGGETFAFAKEGNLTYAHCVTTGSATYYPEKTFTAVNAGQLMYQFDLRYVSGEVNVYFTDGTALNNWPEARIMPIQVKADDGKVKVFLDGTAVSEINANEWVTMRLIIDIDYGTYTLSLNGKTYTTEVESIASNGAKLALVAFQAGKSANEYDVTNLVLATLNTDALPKRTITVASEDETLGTVTLMSDTEDLGTSASLEMNSNVTAVATAAEGYEFEAWKDGEGNVVSYSANYDIRLHNDVSIKASFKAAVYDPIKYAYKEDFSSLTTSGLSDNGWKSANAQGNLTVESDPEHGNYLSFAPGNQNSRGAIKDFGITLDEDYIVEFDTALTAGNNQSTSFSIINGAASNAINDDAASYVFQLLTTNDTKWTVNGTGEVEIPKGTWVHVKLQVNITDGTVGAVITNGETEIYNANVAAVGGTDIKGIHIRGGRYNSITLLDNIKVYAANQATTE